MASSTTATWTDSTPTAAARAGGRPVATITALASRIRTRSIPTAIWLETPVTTARPSQTRTRAFLIGTASATLAIRRLSRLRPEPLAASAEIQPTVTAEEPNADLRSRRQRYDRGIVLGLGCPSRKFHPPFPGLALRPALPDNSTSPFQAWLEGLSRGYSLPRLRPPKAYAQRGATLL